MSNILSTVTLDAVTRKKDKSITLRFTTQTEQSSEQLMEMDRVLNESGVMYFKPNGDLTTEEVEQLESVDLPIEGKSKSQRLRNTLYVLYTQRPCSDKNLAVYCDFKQFYSRELEKIIEHYKQKLN